MVAEASAQDRSTPEALPFQRVLLTGAEGFVGRRLASALRASLPNSARLTLASRHEPAERFEDAVQLDVTDVVAVRAVVARLRPDLVIHLAGQASARAGGAGTDGCWAVNFGGTYNIAGQLARNGAPCLLMLASTADVYGKSFAGGPVSEKTVPQPLSPYSRSKLAAEMMLADILPEQVRSIIIRATNHSGAGQDRRFVLPSLAAQVTRVKMGLADRVEVGNLSVERDFLDVGDVVAAYLALLKNANRLSRRSVFNIASNQLVSIKQLLKRIMVLAGTDAPYVSDPLRMRENDVQCTRIDSTLIREATDWKPIGDLDTMLRAVLADQEVTARDDHAI